jgi:RHS repeat-associated protein
MPSGTSLRSYYRGHDLTEMVGPGGTSRFYHFDHQGTTQCLTNEAGVVTDRFASDAWGVEVKRTGNSINRQWYIGNAGYYRAPDRACNYVRRRYACPVDGVWLSRDPLIQFTGIVRTRLYAYVDNRPSYHYDPSGLRAHCGIAPRPCPRTSGWQRGSFTFCPYYPAPIHPDPDDDWNKRVVIGDEYRKCNTLALQGLAGKTLLGYDNFRAIILHWMGATGND